MKPSGYQWIVNRWPLIEQGLSRLDCLGWFGRVFPGRPLVKSSCIGCPYHSDRQWLDIAKADPQGMARTIALDNRLRDPEHAIRVGGGEEYLHKSCKPLSEVLERLRRIEAEGEQLSMFSGYGNECAGVCEV